MSALSRRIVPNFTVFVRNLSIPSSEPLQTPPKSEHQQFKCFKVAETNPANHVENQLCGYYTVPQSEVHIFQHGGFPKQFMQQCTTFTETSLMIRKPALEIIDFLKNANYDFVPMKYMLYGKPGVGKSLVLAHVLHYASVSKWLLLHVPWVGRWLRSPKEVVNSPTRPGFVDLPENAVKWLIHFKTQNQAIINELDLRLANNYEWSHRESSSAGSSLMDIVDLGLNRSRHASEVIMALVKEIKEFSRQGKCKTLVAIDGYNAFFHPETRVRNENKVIMPPEKISLILPFLEATKNDWHNAAAVLTCDELSVPGHDKSPLPLYQLRIEGFHWSDPFIPINVPEMTETEMLSMLDYYRERRWLQNWKADSELTFLCGGNPYKLMNLCKPL